ncbi:DNA glycosylase, partial [Lineolata rhizophorae]
RPAEPHATNATLQTPGGTRVVAYSASDLSTTGGVDGAASGHSGHKEHLPKPTTTTETLLQEAIAHLTSVDPRLQSLIEKHPCHLFSPKGLQDQVNPFQALACGIMAQQVSGAAAKSIRNRFEALYEGEHFPTPAEVANTSLEVLRTAGLSGRKAEYIQGLAAKFATGELTAKMLANASDEEILEKLTAVRGLGKWSVEMFACFSLKRMDIFSTGDLGVQRGMAAYMGRDVAKLKAKGGKWKYMTEKEMVEISDKFAPYRSLFMWYMWRVEDVNLDALQA